MVGQSEMQTDQAGVGDSRKRSNLGLEILENRHDADGVQTSCGHEVSDRTVNAGGEAVIVGADAQGFHYRLVMVTVIS